MNNKKSNIKIISYLWIISAFVFCIRNNLFEFSIVNKFFINFYMLKALIVIIIIPVIILLGTIIEEESDNRKENNMKLNSPVKKINRKLKPIILKEQEQAKSEQVQASWYGVEKLKNYCQMEIDHITKAVISNVMLKEEIFINLEITQTNLKISETGAIQITVKVKNNTIYHIDGSIKAIFYDENNEKIGFANLVLPALGIVDEGNLTGICIDTNVNQEYRVEYEVNNLWIIESLPNVDNENLIEILSKLKSKKIRLAWTKIKDIDNLKNIINRDTNIYYDNIVDLGNVEYSNDLIKLFKNLELIDLDSDYKMKTQIASALNISEVNFSTAYNQLKKCGAIKIENGFIKVIKSDIEMTEEDFNKLNTKIKSMSYKTLAKANDNMKKLSKKKYLKYASGKRKYDLIRFNYIGKRIQLSDKYGELNKNGVYEISQISSLVNYLNKNIADSDSLYFFLETIKSNRLGTRLVPELVKLRKEILMGVMSPDDEQSKIDQIMNKFKFKEM